MGDRFSNFLRALTLSEYRTKFESEFDEENWSVTSETLEKYLLRSHAFNTEVARRLAIIPALLATDIEFLLLPVKGTVSGN